MTAATRFWVSGMCVAAGLFTTFSMQASGQAPSSAPGAAVTFHKNVEPILQANCQSCHRPGQIAPMPFLTYQQVRPWARAIRERVVSRAMPPWHADPQYGHFANDRSLAQRDIDIIAKWADSGAPQGDPKDAPAPIVWPDGGWLIKPELVVKGVEYAVPKDGTIDWFYYAVPLNFTEDKWVSAMELRPQHLDVNHHWCVYFRPHGPDVQYGEIVWAASTKRDAGGKIIEQPRVPGRRIQGRDGVDITGGVTQEGCYEPGVQVYDYRPYGAARRIPAGTDMVFIMHYQPNGKSVVLDTPEVGFTFAKEPPARQFALYSLGNGSRIKIPPYEPNYQAPTQEAVVQQDAELVWMQPHMHLRGKSMTYRLTYPDGRSETVLNVPRYDFNWQTLYFLKDPIKMPKGTLITIDTVFDNSPRNRFNPDPSAMVWWGHQTTDEMVFPSIGLVVDSSIDLSKRVVAPSPRAAKDYVVEESGTK